MDRGKHSLFPLYVTCGTGTWLIDGWQSRLLVCDADADCPNLVYSNAEYRCECAQGLCQNTDTQTFPRDFLHRNEVASLCLVDTPRRFIFDMTSEEVDAFWAPIDQSCPTSGPDFAVPPECFQLE